MFLRMFLEQTKYENKKSLSNNANIPEIIVLTKRPQQYAPYNLYAINDFHDIKLGTLDDLL